MVDLKLPTWSSCNEDEYLNILTESNHHAKLHKKKPLDNIELCDTIVFIDNKLILCHVKDNFNTTMRVLVAQIQSSADLLTDIKANNRFDEFHESLKKYFEIPNMPCWEIIQDALNDKYEIFECIVMNPSINILNDVSKIRSIIAKYELSTLIKKWTNHIPLIITFPKYGDN